MKAYKVIYLSLIATVAGFTSCVKEETRNSTPVIESIQIDREQVLLTDSIRFGAQLKDPVTPLSTLEVEVLANNQVVNHISIRTKGNDVVLENQFITIPFAAGIAENDAVDIRFTLINVDGNETQQVKTVQAIRPELPETLYFISAETGKTFEMKATEDNPYTYVSENVMVTGTITGKLADNADLNSARFIWSGGMFENEAVIGKATDMEITVSYPFQIIQRLYFDAFDFIFGADMTSLKTVRLSSEKNADGFYYAAVDFTQGEIFAFENVTVQADLYNRDFFDYQDGIFTFLRASGTWELYYSDVLQYLWVTRMEDVAPDCYWIRGHGFTCSPVWTADYYGFGGWDALVERLGYAVKIADNKYQVSMYVNDQHEWGNFEFEIYSDLDWGKDQGIALTAAALTGQRTGFKISVSDGLTTDVGFVPGYYRFTFDTSRGTGAGRTLCNIERLF
ncbi:MAG: DUF5016 domain-containing protein [Tannerella sp.]|jgi:hypothetical protein|nr:DUF5016 domain-containing protein [Tannerella sp.]